MDVAASRTGRAFIVSALTAISGVAVIATSSLPLLHDFGQIVPKEALDLSAFGEDAESYQVAPS